MSQSALIQQNNLQAVAQYKRDGYYIARQILPKSNVRRVFSDMHHLVMQQLKHYGLAYTKGETVEDIHHDLKSLFDHDIKAYIATLTLCAKLTSLYELYLHPNLQEFAAAIGIEFPVFQTAPVMHLMSKELKIPNGYQGFGAHQDWPTLQGGLDTVTLWIPFVSVDRNLYTLEVIPGSHKGGLYPYSRKEHIYEVDPGAYNVNDFVSVEAEIGDVLFMSAFTIHRSSPHGDNRLRVSTSFRYENAAESHFIERNYPFAQKRNVIRELITTDFPSVKMVQKTFE